MKLWRRAAEGVIGAGLSLIVLGLGAGVASAAPFPAPPVPPPVIPPWGGSLELIPDPGSVEEGGKVVLPDTVGEVCNDSWVICRP